MGQAVEVAAKLAGQEDDQAIAVNYDFGDNLQESVQKFGEDVVYTRFKAAAIIDLQSLIRRGIKGDKSASEIQALADNWKPGVKMIVKMSPQEKIKSAFGGMSADEKAELLKQLRADLKAAS